MSNHKAFIKRIGLAIYPFFMLILLSAKAQLPAPNAYEATLNLHFSKVNGLLSGTRSQGIPHFDQYIGNLNDVTELIFSEDEARFELLQKNEKKRLRVLDDTDIKSPYIGFFEAEIKLQWAFTRLKFGEQWNGVWALRSAYKTIRRNIKAYPDFKLNYKTLGLLHVIFGAVPDRHQWVLNILGLKGDTEKGLEELYLLMEEETVFQREVRVITALVESYLMENHEKATALITDQGTPLTHVESYALALVSMKSHKSEDARLLLQKSLGALDNSLAKPLFHYLLAETEFQKGTYQRAYDHYLAFSRSFPGKNNQKDALFKAALCQLMMDDEMGYQDMLEAAKAIEDTESETDKNAQNMMDNEPLPDLSLLKIRYAIDGGYFDRADSLFNSIDIEQYRVYEQFELIYRKARLHHLKADRQEAIRLYRQVVEKEKLNPETYFVPNSFLQLGYLQAELGNTPMARMYFEKVLKFRNHPYKNSLDSKAKIALKRLENQGD